MVRPRKSRLLKTRSTISGRRAAEVGLGSGESVEEGVDVEGVSVGVSKDGPGVAVGTAETVVGGTCVGEGKGGFGVELGVRSPQPTVTEALAKNNNAASRFRTMRSVRIFAKCRWESGKRGRGLIVRWECCSRVQSEESAKLCKKVIRSFHRFYLYVSICPTSPRLCYILLSGPPFHLHSKRNPIGLSRLQRELRIVAGSMMCLSTTGQVFYSQVFNRDLPLQ